MTAPLRLVVFDVDGTLIDSQEMIVAAMGRAFGGLGIDLPGRDEVLSIVGLSLDQAIARLVPELDAAQVAQAAALYRQAFLTLRAETGGEADVPLFPGARRALELLHAHDELLMGIATGKARRGLEHVFAAHDLGHFFATSQTADNHPSKPHPAMLLQALAETGVDANNAVMIGDTTFDMEMGRAAGVRTIGVSWGYHPRDALDADLVIDAFDALPQALADLWDGQR